MKDVDLMEKCLEDAEVCLKKVLAAPNCAESADRRATAVAIIAAELYFSRSEDVMLDWEGGETEDIPF